MRLRCEELIRSVLPSSIQHRTLHHPHYIQGSIRQGDEAPVLAQCATHLQELAVKQGTVTPSWWGLWILTKVNTPC